MTERDVFERRLEAVRGYVEAAPTEIDAARLTVRWRQTPRAYIVVPARLEAAGLGRWILVVAALLAMLGMGLFASGALRDVHLLPVPPTSNQTLETPPAVIASPAPAATAESSQRAPITTLPIGIVLPSNWVPGEQARFQDALKATGYGARS
jgi:hypothetical protein